MSKIQEKINEILLGIDVEFSKQINGFKTLVDNPMYSTEYKIKACDDYIEKTKSMRNGYYQKVLVAIEDEKKNLNKPAAGNKSIDEKILDELQRNNKLLLMQSKIKTANMEQLKEIYDANSEDNDIKDLVLSELPLRTNTEQDITIEDKARALRLQINANTPEEQIKAVEGQIKWMEANEGMIFLQGGVVQKDIVQEYRTLAGKSEYFLTK